MRKPIRGHGARRLILTAAFLTAGITTAGAETIINRADLPVLSKSGKSTSATKAASTSVQAGSTALYWYDGKRKRALVTEADTIADFGTADKRKAQPELRSTPALGSKAAQTEQAEGTSPLFVDAASGRIAGALPGGVLVHMPRAIDIEAAAALAQQFDTQVQGPVGAPSDATNSQYELWLFNADAGMASLELANRLHESGAVQAAAPNWWKPRTLK